MDFTSTNFKFYDIDQGDQEKLIEMWKHFNKKDNIEPNDANSVVILGKKNEKVIINNYALMFNLLYPVFQRLGPIDTFFRTCLHLRMQEIVAYMYKHFTLKHTEHAEVILEDIPEDTKPKRRSKKKE